MQDLGHNAAIPSAQFSQFIEILCVQLSNFPLLRQKCLKPFTLQGVQFKLVHFLSYFFHLLRADPCRIISVGEQGIKYESSSE